MKAEVLIVGQGLCGTCLAWELEKAGISWYLIDRLEAEGSSRVAAGLVTPITGKGLNPSWRQAEFLPEAQAFYRNIEVFFDQKFWHPMPVLRLFSSLKEREKWERKCQLPTHAAWWDPAEPVLPAEIKNPFGGFVMRGGGWLDTRAFLDASRSHFEALGKMSREDLADFDSDGFEQVFRCEGSAGLIGGKRPHRSAKGEILTVRIPGLDLKSIVNRQGWLVPLGEGIYRAGATYEWDTLDSLPTLPGRRAIEDKIRSFTDLPFEILDHVAGVRPILRHSIPVVERSQRGWWVNGLGSKGSMAAPSLARLLREAHQRGSGELDLGIEA